MKSFRLLSLLVLLGIIVFFIGCSDDDDDVAKKPVVNITSLSDDSVVTVTEITITGTASVSSKNKIFNAEESITEVSVRVNDGDWQTASGTTSWSKTVGLSEGSNTISARAQDNEGAYSDIESITVTYNFVEPPEDFVYVEGGVFEMGARTAVDGNDAQSDEYPLHSVELDDFYISKYEVTQGEYESVTGDNPAVQYGEGENHPVYFVTWYDAVEYCNKLSIIDQLTPCYEVNGSTDPDNWGSYDYNDVTCNWSVNGYRLPTEAEWEYAARGGQLSEQDYLYSGSNTLDAVGWYGYNYGEGNSGNGTNEVSQLEPNELGLYDMSGNVYEWCWDMYDISYYQECYSQGAVSNPTGPVNGSFRVIRGGSWGPHAKLCRSAYRSLSAPSYCDHYIGFRLVRR